jgi:glycosyltransferase involved in cell wall biosynthesis
MTNIIVIDQNSSLDQIAVENRPLGATEYQLYKLIESLSLNTNYQIVCFNKKSTPQYIGNIYYKPLKLITDPVQHTQQGVVLYTQPIPVDIVLKYSQYTKIWWRHNLCSNTEIERHKKLIDETDYFVFPSRYALSQFTEVYNVNPNKTIVIPNILYEKEFIDTKLTTITKNTTHIVYGSAWSKGVETVVDVITAYNEHNISTPIVLQLMHPGYGIQKYNHQLEYIHHKLPHHSVVLGKLSKPLYAQHIKKALATIAPDFKETFGCVFAESLYLGTPVIYHNNNEALKQLVGPVGMCDYYSIGSVIDTINSFRQNPRTCELSKEYLYDHCILLWHNLIQ